MTRLMMKLMRSGFFLLFSMVELQADEVRDQDELKLPAIPRRGYPKQRPIPETPCELMSLQVASIELLPKRFKGLPNKPVKELPRITEIDPGWKHARAGDEIYDISSWFLLVEGNKIWGFEENRWVYYNRSNGYIIAYADLFLKATIQTFASHSIMMNGFKPRISMIYLEVSDKVELNFQAIQKSPHKILLRGSAIQTSMHKFITEGSEIHDMYQGSFDYPMHVEFSNADHTTCDVSVEPNDNWRLYYLGLKLKLEGDVAYENKVAIVPNKWIIQECGISLSGKRKVLAIRVDHVNHLGEGLHFPCDGAPYTNIGIAPVEGSGEDPFGDENSYRFYRMPICLFSGHKFDEDGDVDETEDDHEDPFGTNVEETHEWQNRVNVSKYFERLVGVELEGCEASYFLYQDLLMLRCDLSGHRAMEGLLAQLDLRHQIPSLRSNLLFYEIEHPLAYEARAWKIEDILSGNPVMLGSIASLLSSGEDARMMAGENECTLMLVYPDEDEPSETRPQTRRFELDLNMPSMKITQKYQGVIKIGRPEVVCLGKNPDNNKLIMMLIKVNKLDRPK